ARRRADAHEPGRVRGLFQEGRRRHRQAGEDRQDPDAGAELKCAPDVGWVEALRAALKPQPCTPKPIARLMGFAGAQPILQTYVSCSWNTSSRLERIVGNATMMRSSSAAIKRPRLIGRCRKIIGSPPEMRMARRRFSSISGPSTKPRIIGAGSHCSRVKT